MIDTTTDTPLTTLPTREPLDVPQEKRRMRSIQRTDVLSLLGSLGAAAATTSAFALLTPLSSVAGLVVVGYLFFLGYYAVLVSFDESKETVRDRIAAALIHTTCLVLLSVLVLVVAYTLVRGFPAMVHWNFYTEDRATVRPSSPLTEGGIKHAIIGTLEQISIALAITIPLGILCAVYLNEFPGRAARTVRTIVEAMTALPSIVAGLFIYATWIIGFKSLPGWLPWAHRILGGHDKSGLAAAFAISVMMLPIIIRAADVVLRLVPGHLKEASYALGTSHWRTVWHVVLPTARSGLTTAVILGTARGIGETSPVLLTAGYNSITNWNPTKGPQVSLPLQAFSDVKAPSDVMITRGFGTAAFLLVLVLLLFIVARLIGGRAPGQLTNRQRRKIANQSERDAQRMAARIGVRVGVVAIGLGLVGAFLVHPTERAYAADNYVPISGAGSTWSQNALMDWASGVVKYGMRINYQGTGSSDGRNQFRNDTVDFGVSEIPYGLTDGGVTDTPPARKFAYMPIVAGGTSFMYNLKISGKRVTNLRMSGENIARIFTGKAKMWNDPAIQKDNPGLKMPPRPIKPVVRSDGSGTTAQLTTWLNKRYQNLWGPYCGCNGITSNFPVKNGSGFTAQAQSLGVAGYVSQDQNDGTITYVEYSYAKNAGFPVVKMLNKAGYYVGPTAANVAVGLLAAKINNTPSSTNYLTQILDGVYDNPDKRAYPLSSYSYMIIPTATTTKFSTAKGKTLGAFAKYFLCDGQQQADDLGYSPLPKNLVQAGLAQVKRIPGVDPSGVDISKCNNPTFSASGKNLLAQNAPYPPACDKVGTTQCVTGAVAPGSDGNPGDGSGDGPTNGGNNPTTGPAGVPSTGPQTIDPDTGQLVNAAGQTDGGFVSGTPQSLDGGFSSATQILLMVLAGLVLLGVVIVPPMVGRYLDRGQG